MMSVPRPAEKVVGYPAAVINPRWVEDPMAPGMCAPRDMGEASRDLIHALQAEGLVAVRLDRDEDPESLMARQGATNVRRVGSETLPPGPDIASVATAETYSYVSPEGAARILICIARAQMDDVQFDMSVWDTTPTPTQVARAHVAYRRAHDDAQWPKAREA